MASKRRVTDSDIDALRKLFSGTKARVIVPSDSGYAKTIERWSRAAEKPAGVSIEPTSAEEVAIAVKYARDHGIDLAVKGGGHSTAGVSSTNGGILINLGLMRNVTVDPDKELLYIQGGALWADVDSAAWKHGLATVGGTVADTGVGGLTLGGGYGILSGVRGLVIDNVISATVVLASGKIVNASKNENPDLFWALLGAGQNFGVTTELVMQAYPQEEVFCGLLAFLPTPENVGKIVAAVNDLYEVKQTAQGPVCKSQGRTFTLLGFVRPPEALGATMILTICTYLGPESKGREIFKPFFDIGPVMDTMKMEPWPTVNTLAPAVYGMRSSMKGAAFTMPLRVPFVSEVLNKYEEFMNSCDDAGPSVVAFELFDPTFVVTRDVGSFANRGYHLNGLVMPTWGKAENDQQCRQWARDMSSMFKKELETQGEHAAPGVEGGASVRGHKGAVMLYGNYDVSGNHMMCFGTKLIDRSNTMRSRKISSARTIPVFKR